MANSKSHPFPFHPFLKEYMLGTGGKTKDFSPTAPVSLVPGMHGNGWEWVGTGESFKGVRND